MAFISFSVIAYWSSFLFGAKKDHTVSDSGFLYGLVRWWIKYGDGVRSRQADCLLGGLLWHELLWPDFSFNIARLICFGKMKCFYLLRRLLQCWLGTGNICNRLRKTTVYDVIHNGGIYRLISVSAFEWWLFTNPLRRWAFPVYASTSKKESFSIRYPP